MNKKVGNPTKLLDTCFIFMTEGDSMSEQSNFVLNLSVLYRNTQKYFDKVLVPYDIGYGQLMFLLCINENEGITMQELTRIGEVDKGTTTKSIQRLIDQGYINTRQDENDKRVKRLYTTEKAAGIMGVVYDLRNALRTTLAKNMDFKTFESMLEQAADNARSLEIPEEDSLKRLRIGGLQKMTLLDYPGKVACTIFMAGCNYKCPFCHNRDLVFIPERFDFFEPDDVLAYLGKRKGLLDGVCISGGEPLMQKDLIPLLQKIKDMGYLIKLDTNGGFPQRLKTVVESGLIDYVAMDIKNSPSKYAETLGMNPDAFNFDAVRESISYLLEGHIDYEFRTTVVREMHTMEDMREIAKWISGAKKYYLQQFTDSGNLIQEGWSAYSEEEMYALRDAVREYIPQAEVRGVKEG